MEYLYTMAEVYAIRCNGYVYYGSTRNSSEYRFKQHLRDLRRGKHANARLQCLYDSGAEMRPRVIASGLSLAQSIEMEDAILKIERRNPKCVNVKFNAVLVNSNKSKRCQWNGKAYKSVAQAHRADPCGLSLTQIKHYIQSGINEIEIVRSRAHHKAKQTEWDGMVYESVKDAIASGKTPFKAACTLNRWLSLGVNTTEQWHKAKQPKEKPKPAERPMIHWNGKQFKFRQHAIADSKLCCVTWLKAYNAGMTCDDDWLKKRRITWKGQDYDTVMAASRATGLPYNTIYQIVKNEQKAKRPL
jgi:hypothetical protein